MLKVLLSYLPDSVMLCEARCITASLFLREKKAREKSHALQTLIYLSG